MYAIRSYYDSNDIAEVCKANGVRDAEVIESIINSAKSDLRQVERLIHKYMKALKQVA